MTRSWRRCRDLSLPLDGVAQEAWQLWEDDQLLLSHPLDVRLGKPFDVLRLKGRTTDHLRKWAAQAREAADTLYGPESPRRILEACPCCRAPAGAAPELARIHGVAYVRCRGCSHLFVRAQPSIAALNTMFAENDDYAHEYVDATQIELRLSEIVAPKLAWVKEIFRKQYGREPGRAVDVGAGGGHFVGCCRRSGLAAEGYEINQAACRFARTAFDVDLRSSDFLTAQPDGFDLVTLWGLLEYTPEPARFLAAARRLLPDDGMLILEVPRADAFGTAIQTQYPDAVWRHLEPSSHVNIYSDASVATLLHVHGFRPVAAWYFGMDFYEMLTLIAADLGDDGLITRLAPLIGPMQNWLDAAQLADDIVVAAVPWTP